MCLICLRVYVLSRLSFSLRTTLFVFTFFMRSTFGGHFDDVTSIDWSSDSKYFVTGSLDQTVRVYKLRAYGYVPYTLSGHRDYIISASFNSDDTKVCVCVCLCMYV